MNAFHYTDSDGHKAIASQAQWSFCAVKPPGDRPTGAYFTTLRPARNLCARLRIPKTKTEFAFSFAREDGLVPLDGGRGEYVFYSPIDYNVPDNQQLYHGPSEELP